MDTRHQINRSHRVEHLSAQEKSNILNDSELNPVCHDSTAALNSRLQFLRAVSHFVGAHTESLQPQVDNSSNSNSSEDEDENRQAPVPAAPASGASESATEAAATLGRLLRSVHRGATCWLLTGAV